MSDCILWTKSIKPEGYGQTYYKGKVTRAHRAEWMKVNGPIPKGMVLDHTCHNPKTCSGGFTCIHRRCVNLDHLRLVTQQENIMAGKLNIDNRSHCNKGHLFEGNIMVRKNGKRECAECNRVRARANWAKKVSA